MRMAFVRVVSRRPRLIIVTALLVCASASGRGVAATESLAVASSCATSLVHYQPDPAAGARTGALPWVRGTPSSAGLLGQLFYYAGTTWQQASLPRARIYTGGRTPNGGSTKILWLAQGSGAGLVLVVHGRRLERRGSFTQRFSTVGGDQFPSIVNVPAAGCWQLQLISGSKRARVTFLAVPQTRAVAGFAATKSSRLPPLPRWLMAAEARTLDRGFGGARPIHTWYTSYPRKIAVTFVFNRVVVCGACSAPSNASLPRGRVIRVSYDRQTHRQGNAIRFCESRGSLPPLSQCLRH